MKGYFVRKPGNIEDLRKARETGKTAPIKVIATVDLEPAEFEHFANHLLRDYDFIEEHTEKSGMDKEGNEYCILVGTRGCPEKIAVNPEGYSYARYAALITEEES